MSANPATELALLAPAAAASPAPALQVDTVSDHDSLLALEPAWNRLLDEAGIDHPFLSHEWVRTWWECFGAGQRLHVLVVRAGSEVVAIAPMMLGRGRVYGLGVRQLQLIANVHTQRADFIVGSRPEAAYQAIWRCLADQRDLWDVLVLPQVPAGSATLDQLPRLAAGEGFRVGIWGSADSPYLRLAGSWDAYFNRLARKHRSNLRNRLKRLSRLGPVELEVVSAGPRVGPALEEGFCIEGAAWKGSAGTAIGCRPRLRLFYTRLATRAAQRGWLRLQFLTVGGHRIAFAYALCVKKTLYLLKPGYDPAYACYSPSNLLCSLVLRDAFARGLAAFDFLGMDDRWKLDWTAEVRPHSWIFVFPDGPLGRLLHFTKFRLLPSIKRVYRTARALVAGASLTAS